MQSSRAPFSRKINLSVSGTCISRGSVPFFARHKFHSTKMVEALAAIKAHHAVAALHSGASAHATAGVNLLALASGKLTAAHSLSVHAPLSMTVSTHLGRMEIY